jgi:hypothetical protein
MCSAGATQGNEPNPALDVRASQYADDSRRLARRRNIDGLDNRVGAGAAQQNCRPHLWQPNVVYVNSRAGYRAGDPRAACAQARISITCR